MSQYHLRWGGLASLVYVILSAIAPTAVRADIPLTRADVDAFRNQVEIMLRGGPSRPVRPSDWLSIGDAIRTNSASQVDLRFNDGSLARVGELSTFWFVPNTRSFRLSNGTALFLIPPGNGSSIIETPNVVTGVQGTAVVVRHFPENPNALTAMPDLSSDFESNAGRTAVMVLSDGSGGPVEVRLRDGRAVNLSAGQIAIVDNGDLYLFEFDLALFYETSPLVEGLFLDEPDLPEDSSPTAPVRHETWEGLSEQENFEGDYLLNPSFLSPNGDVTAEGGWLFPANAAPNATSNAASDSTPNVTPISPPHDTSGTAIDLTPPDEVSPTDDLSAPGDDLSAPGRDREEPPNTLPPGLINPTPDEVAPSVEPPVTNPEPFDLPEVTPPDDIELPEIDDLPGDDDGPAGE